MSESKKLFTHFPPVSTEEWMDKVNKDLKGDDFEKRLVWRSREGVDVRPFYREEDLENLAHMGTLPGEFPYVRGNGNTSNDWFIRQDITVIDPESANKKARGILNKGVNSLGFRFSTETKFSIGFLEKLLDGIYIEIIELNFYPEGSAMELLAAFKELINNRGIKPNLVKGSIETDPLGKYMVNGKLCIPVDDGLIYLKELIEKAAGLSNFKVVRINGANFSNAGASVIQQLGMTLSMANEYLASISEKGLAPDYIAKSLGFAFGVGSNYFFEIARIRAARMLWAIITQKYGIKESDAQKMNIHSVTSNWNKTIYDPYVNMLRTQTESMSAILGGTDSLTVNSFNLAYSEPSEFSERIARNQQLLLKEESHFDKIADPAAGSYYIENLTASVAEKAWEIFMEIENEGGFLASLKTGLIQKRVENNAQKRNGNLAKGREKLLGTNIYPNFNEHTDYVPENTSSDSELTEVKPLKIYRGAELFEQLRSDTDRHHVRPKVFMFTIGNLVMRKARAQFSSSFFAVAGYEIIDNIGFNSVEEGVEAALEANADIVVVCSSDEEYKVVAPQIYDSLVRKTIVVIAGIPGCEEDLRKIGIENFISIKSDILQTLKGFNKLLGIKQL